MNKNRKTSKVRSKVNEAVSDVYGYYFSPEELDDILPAAKRIYVTLKRHVEALEDDDIEQACFCFEQVEDMVARLNEVIEDAKYE